MRSIFQYLLKTKLKLVVQDTAGGELGNLKVDMQKNKKIKNICHHLLLFVSKYLIQKLKPVYNDHPRDSNFVVVVYWWSLLRGSFVL
jgi:hypothetical protein